MGFYFCSQPFLHAAQHDLECQVDAGTEVGVDEAVESERVSGYFNAVRDAQ